MRRRRISAAIAAIALLAAGSAAAAPAAASSHHPTTRRHGRAGQPGHHAPEPKNPWSGARRLTQPVDDDLQAPTVEISPRGNVTVAYGVTYEDAPQTAYAELIAGEGGSMRTVTTTTVTRLHGGRRSAAAPRATTVVSTQAGIPFTPPPPPRTSIIRAHHRAAVKRVTRVTERGRLGTEFTPPERVPSAEQVLALGTLDDQPELLTGNGNNGALTGDTASGVDCCLDASAQGRVSAGLYAGPQPLAGALGGGASGALVSEAHGALAVIDSANGLWDEYGSARAGFTKPAHQLASFSGQAPVVAAGTLSGGRALIVWTEPRTGVSIATRRQSLYYAVAPAGQPAGARRLALTVRAGLSIGQIAVARHQGVASIAWVQSWQDRSGHYHSRVYAADLRGGAAVDRHAVSPPGVQASALSFGGGGDRPEVLAWQACAPGAAGCQAQAALRPRGGAWAAARQLGSLTAGESPVAAVTGRGTVLVDWVSRGDVLAVSAPAGADAFASPARLDRSGRASQLTLAVGPLGTAAAAWTDGSAAQSVEAAFYSPLR